MLFDREKISKVLKEALLLFPRTFFELDLTPRSSSKKFRGNKKCSYKSKLSSQSPNAMGAKCSVAYYDIKLLCLPCTALLGLIWPYLALYGLIWPHMVLLLFFTAMAMRVPHLT